MYDDVCRCCTSGQFWNILDMSGRTVCRCAMMRVGHCRSPAWGLQGLDWACVILHHLASQAVRMCQDHHGSSRICQFFFFIVRVCYIVLHCASLCIIVHHCATLCYKVDSQSMPVPKEGRPKKLWMLLIYINLY